MWNRDYVLQPKAENGSKNFMGIIDAKLLSTGVHIYLLTRRVA